ncbi:MAG TPA: ABC transporter permease, partial [Chryseosolibacter sp.]
MVLNYLTIAFRNLFKSKVYSFLNIFGLALGVAAFLFIIHYVRFEKSYEQYNPQAENIYRITLDLYNGNEYVVTDCETYAPIGPILKDKMPEVVDYVRMMHNDGLQDIHVNDRAYLEEGMYFADPSAMQIFAINLINGDENDALGKPFQVALCESLAKKYFGRTDVVGETLKWKQNEYHVTGVFKDVPVNTHLKFNMLLSHASLPQLYGWYKDDSFNGNNEYTYLLMKPRTDLAAFQAKLDLFSQTLKDKIGNEKFGAERVTDIHLYSTKSFEPEPPGNIKVVTFMLAIAAFIIVIAWVNYVNLSTARAVERAREVGIRKVLGSAKLQLILQFLSESVIINVMACVLALGIFQTALPLFRELAGLALPLQIVSDLNFWSLFAALLLGGSLLSGLYPACVLSSFQPVAVLKGKFKSSAHGQQLRKALVVFQFASAVVLLIGISAVYLQIKHLRTQDLGMEIDRTLSIRTPYMDEPDSVIRSKFQVLKTELLGLARVEAVTSSEGLPGLSLHELSTTSNVKRVGHESEGGSYNYYYSAIDADFIPALDMQLTAGNNFHRGLENKNQVIINEESVSRLGFTSASEAVGSRITFRGNDGQPCTIVGVLKNYNYQSPKEQQIPMLFYYDALGSYHSVKLKAGDMHASVSSVEAIWHKVFPGAMFNYFFLDEKYDQQFKADSRFGYVTATFSLLA